MEKVLIKGASIVESNKVHQADLLIEKGIITKINQSIQPDSATAIIKAEDKYILPGFIDIHNHGSVGFDASFGTYQEKTDSFNASQQVYKKGLKTALDFYINMGVTKVLLTTMAAPLDKLCVTLGYIKSFLDEHSEYKKLVYGINLEGTFLKDPAYAGAQNPAYFYEADQHIIDKLQEASGNLLKIVNIPPEHGKKGCELTRKLVKNGVVVAGGHSAAFGDEYAQAVDAGLNLAVHFLNGPSRSNSKSYRNGGAVEVMLRSDEVFLEIICDGYHVDPSYVRDVIARKGYERVIMITDTMFANGLVNLERFELLGLKGAVSKNKQFLQVLGAENTLFGSVLKSDVGYANVISWLTRQMSGTWHRMHEALSLNEALVQASVMFSTNPAKLVGIYENNTIKSGTGSIEVGKSADLLVADIALDKFSITHNVIQGRVYACNTQSNSRNTGAYKS
ncbi:MAG: amidohydrolase family protein [Cyclobacteriaceae bacterium]|nr:amidohydrolase family protein [Cyclobacteriaceae bacterium]